ncbi:hypothetical protein SDC9_209856 [bioreactor metagenome]|uniref:Uncharacterized protein n=1 Tax=bioreactor metagenome TaxID=1076179 RepID=A0A645JHD6_9ZZZZ
MPATVSSSAARNASTSTQPSARLLILTTVKPAMAALAGLVPWALSGTSILTRWLSPRASWYFLTQSIPYSSPCAPAAGCRVNASIPAISHSAAESCSITALQPVTACAGGSGWALAKPVSLAAASFTAGLYFMVQLPSG